MMMSPAVTCQSGAVQSERLTAAHGRQREHQNQSAIDFPVHEVASNPLTAQGRLEQGHNLHPMIKKTKVIRHWLRIRKIADHPSTVEDYRGHSQPITRSTK
jgi:hypothetical protein